MISIIIPVYNVEKYISQCIESVISQSYKDIEIILINDGSTDKSGEICDTYASIDNRIKVIHKKNGGLSDARNRGLDVCTGKYVMFLDSDDYWNKDFLKDINKKIINNPKLDFITADGYLGKFSGGKEVPITCNFDKENFIYENGEKFLEFALSYKNHNGINWHWSAWRNVYRTEIIKENNIYFKKGIINEDAEWTPRVILECNYFDFIPDSFYNYRLDRPNSIMNVCSFKKIDDYLETVNYWLKYAEGIDNKNLSKVIKKRFSENFFDYLKYIYLLDKIEIKEIISKLEKSNFINYVDKQKFLIKLIKIFGYKYVLIIMNIEYRLKTTIKNLAIKFNLIKR